MPGGIPVADASSLVPYTGASADVDLGSRSFTTTGSGNYGHLRNSDEVVFPGTWAGGWTETNIGAGTRLLWYPRKAAFRAGKATGAEWNNANIGNYSFAAGYSSKASGSASVAMGSSGIASGDNAIAAGDSTHSTAYASLALGGMTTASGNYSVAMGFSSTASGAYSVAMGLSSIASGEGSLAMGGTASNYYSVAMGHFVKSCGSASFALGMNENEDDTSFVAGTDEESFGSVALGYASVGHTLKATGKGAFALGQNVNALANNAFAFGLGISNSTASSFAIGFGQVDLSSANGYTDSRLGYKCGGTSPAADGTYTIGAKLTSGGVNGTITVKGGIITAIQAAT